MKVLLVLTIIWLPQISNARSEFALFETAVQYYIEESSYATLALLKTTFAGNPTSFSSVSVKFGVRKDKIPQIQISKDIAAAKVNNPIPAIKMTYIDLFLLKKIKDGWKIRSKTATRVDENR